MLPLVVHQNMYQVPGTVPGFTWVTRATNSPCERNGTVNPTSARRRCGWFGGGGCTSKPPNPPPPQRVTQGTGGSGIPRPADGVLLLSTWHRGMGGVAPCANHHITTYSSTLSALSLLSHHLTRDPITSTQTVSRACMGAAYASHRHSRATRFALLYSLTIAFTRGACKFSSGSHVSCPSHWAPAHLTL